MTNGIFEYFEITTEEGAYVVFCIRRAVLKQIHDAATELGWKLLFADMHTDYNYWKSVYIMEAYLQVKLELADKEEYYAIAINATENQIEKTLKQAEALSILYLSL